METSLNIFARHSQTGCNIDLACFVEVSIYFWGDSESPRETALPELAERRDCHVVPNRSRGGGFLVVLPARQGSPAAQLSVGIC